MSKIIASTVIIVIAASFFSCSKDNVKKDESEKTKITDTTKTNTVNVDEIVTKISKFRAEGEAKLNGKKFTKKEVPLTGDNIKADMKQKWEKVDAYYDGDKITRIQFYPHKETSNRTEEFYLMDGKIAFAFIQETEEKHEGSDMGEEGKEFYFDNDKLIKYVNNTKEIDRDIESAKKMYEVRLVYEIKEILEVLKTVK